MTEQDFIEILEERRYTQLTVKRYGFEHFLIIEHDGKSNVLVRKDGRRKTFRHEWQVRDWLKHRFDIELDESIQ